MRKLGLLRGELKINQKKTDNKSIDMESGAIWSESSTMRQEDTTTGGFRNVNMEKYCIFIYCTVKCRHSATATVKAKHDNVQ